MGDRSKIEWTDATWGPVTGCTKVSEGCDHCYAETIAHRFAGTKAYPNGFDVTLRPERLDQPLHWRRPRRIFVNSMSDLFHKDVPDEYIARVFAVMALAPQHTFQVLTKRPGRMRSLLGSEAFRPRVETEALRLKTQQWAAGEYPCGRKAEGRTRWTFPGWPLPNIWLGTSVENQKWADVRVPQLLATPAAIRFLSCEPLLGLVDLTGSGIQQTYWLTGRPGWGPEESVGDVVMQPLTIAPSLDWVIVGGESGPGARPMHPDWARSLRDQCLAVGVPFLFKQWGEWAPFFWTADHPTHYFGDGVMVGRVGKKIAGRMLDGRTWDEYPEAK